MVISGKFAFSKEKSQTCNLKKTFFNQTSVLFLLKTVSFSAVKVVSIVPSFIIFAIDNFDESLTADDIPESIAEETRTEEPSKKLIMFTFGLDSRHASYHYSLQNI